MVVATNPTIKSPEKIRTIDIPIIDLSGNRSEISKLIVKACEDFGFFKVVNHGVPFDVINRMEVEGFGFFSKPGPDKLRAGPPNPFGYGTKSIGFNGDIGDVEYLLLDTNNVSHLPKSISNDPSKFSFAVSGYVEAVKGLACEILELMAEGLWVPESSVFSKLIRAVDSDSLLRLNHYPPSFHNTTNHNNSRIGFGEHSDPQILTILRSNDVGGLQISLEDGVWLPVSPDPTAFCVNVGDVLQAMTNGRFVSVRHRAMANPYKSRMSIAYFSAPPLDASITCAPELVSPDKPYPYRPFTWSEYKKATYSLRLGDSRLNLFKLKVDHLVH